MTVSRFRFAFGIGVAAALSACSAPDADAPALYGHAPRADLGSSGTPDGSSGASNAGSNHGAGAIGGGSAFVPAAHPPMPQMVSSGGAVLAAPKVVPVLVAGDPFQADIVAFLGGIGATEYWRANTAEYGVAPLVMEKPVVLDQPLPATMSSQAVEQVLANAIASGRLPAADENTLYMLFPPQTTTVASGADKSCVTFGGYHYEGHTAAGAPMVYAVVPRCAKFNDLTGIDMVTVAASHELIEAATDPFVLSGPAFRQPDADHAIWGLLFTSEAGDMCAQNADVNVKVPGFPYRVQKSWSNAAAAASHDPCAPNLPGQVYFNAAPALDDVIQVNGGGSAITTKGVKLAIGEKKTIDVTLYSDAPTSAPWTVTPIDVVQLMSGTKLLEFEQSATEGQNGDHIRLTITLAGVDPTYGAAPFVLKSTLGGSTTFWVGAVSN